MVVDLVVGAGRECVGEVVEELPVLAGDEGRVQRQVHLRHGQGVAHLVLGHLHLARELGEGRLAPQLLGERRRAPADPVHGARAGERHPHDPRLLGESLQDRLADPPDGVGDELDALGLVELPGRPHQPDVSLVDQVGERHPLVLVLLGHRDHEAEVGPDELVHRLGVAVADSPREPGFLLAVDEGVRRDVAQVLIERLGFCLEPAGGGERHRPCSGGRRRRVPRGLGKARARERGWGIGETGVPAPEAGCEWNMESPPGGVNPPAGSVRAKGAPEPETPLNHPPAPSQRMTSPMRLQRTPVSQGTASARSPRKE